MSRRVIRGAVMVMPGSTLTWQVSASTVHRGVAAAVN